jgi:hypothetical protein
MKIVIYLIILFTINNYLYSQHKLDRNVIGYGSVNASCTNYSIKGTLGQTAIGNYNSSNGLSYKLGFWYTVNSNLNVRIKSIDNLSESEVRLSVEISMINSDPAVTQKGVVWSTSQNPTLTSNLGKTEQGAGGGNGPRIETFSTTISNLANTTTYYIRPYATNNIATYLGEQVTITTIPTLPEWGLILFACLITGLGIWNIWNKIVI